MKILIRNLTFEARHGATEAEQRQTRRFQVDVDLDAEVEMAGQTDALADTIDYGWVCSQLMEVGMGKTRHLIETLAQQMVERIAERAPEAGITVEVRKLHPPCAGNPAYTAVRASRPKPTTSRA